MNTNFFFVSWRIEALKCKSCYCGFIWWVFIGDFSCYLWTIRGQFNYGINFVNFFTWEFFWFWFGIFTWGRDEFLIRYNWNSDPLGSKIISPGIRSENSSTFGPKMFQKSRFITSNLIFYFFGFLCFSVSCKKPGDQETQTKKPIQTWIQ